MDAKQPYEVEIHYDVRIPMRDGLSLSANLFLPVALKHGQRFPAVLEMIPYRKDDWRYNTDVSRMTYLAQRGIAGCRLDVRGTGSSPGIALDEYTLKETEDGYDAVEWLASQPWCNGKVGMWGISYGGFTSIQVAKMRPPHLKAIVPMYATDDRYLDDVHYVGGCKTASDYTQYGVGMVAMNALPPKLAYTSSDWAERWKERLEQTPPWLINWLKQQLDGSYWRRGSLAPDYDQITCAIFHIAGWTDSYTNAALHMQEKCHNAPRKVLVGNWVHDLPDVAYPGPNLDWLHEMVRFFEYWLMDVDNGVMDEPPVTFFLQEYTEPEAFPRTMNGKWVSADAYPVPETGQMVCYLGAGDLQAEPDQEPGQDPYLHRPTHGTGAGLCWGAGSAPTGLARDLRPDEALGLTYTSDPLEAPLDIFGFPQAILFLSCSAPVAYVVVRLTDVAPDGTSSLITTGILNLTHRDGHTDPQPLIPGQVYRITVDLKAAGYRFLTGHRIRLSVSSAYWPAFFPSPYQATNVLHRGGDRPSRLILPVVPSGGLRSLSQPFKTTRPRLPSIGSGSEEPCTWQIIEDVVEQSVMVKIFNGGTSILPDGTSLYAAEMMEMTAFHHDPAHTRLYNEVVYQQKEHGHEIEILASGTIRTTLTDFHIDVQLKVLLNGNLFWQKSWLADTPRQLL